MICDQSTDRFKIGVTRDLKSNRIKKLQTGNSTELFVMDIYETEWPFRLETLLHRHFKNRRVLNEWFALARTSPDFTGSANGLKPPLRH